MNIDLLREPRKGKFDWVRLGFGVLMIAFSIAGILVDDEGSVLFSVDPEFFLLGLAFTTNGGAELLSVDRRQLAALLRFVAIGSFVSFGAAIILTF